MNTMIKRKTILKNTYDEDENHSEEYYGEDEGFEEG